jgi:hypothetical protein
MLLFDRTPSWRSVLLEASSFTPWAPPTACACRRMTSCMSGRGRETRTAPSATETRRWRAWNTRARRNAAARDTRHQVANASTPFRQQWRSADGQ